MRDKPPLGASAPARPPVANRNSGHLARTKTCTQCQVSKPLAEFHKNSRYADGLRSECKRCVAAYHAAYYAINRWRIAAKVADYQATNREKVNACNAAYRAANREKIAAYRAAYRAANREKVNAYQTAYYAANRERLTAKRKARLPQRGAQS